MSRMSASEAELSRLRQALDIVQGDLSRTVPSAPELHIHVVPGDDDYEPGVYVAGSNCLYWSGGTVLTGETAAFALETVANGVQDYLIEVERSVWPMCHPHQRGTHIRPHRALASWTTEDRFEGPPAWWCSAQGRHELALVGDLNY